MATDNKKRNGEDSNQSLKQRSISSLMWKFLERGGNAIVQMVVQVVMARLLMPSDFGALAIMLVFVNIGNVFVQSGLNTALIQAKDVDDGSYSTVFWMSLCISLVLYLGVFAIAPFVADSYSMPQIVWPLRVLCLILVINSYNAVQVARVVRELQMRKTFVATIMSVVVSGVAGTTAALNGLGLWALVIQQLVYQMTNCLVLSLQVSWRPSLVFKSAEATRLFRFGWKLLVSGLLNTAYLSLSDLIVGAKFSADALGIMSQGKKYPQALANALDGAIQPVMLSTVSHVSSDVMRAKSVTRRALKSSFYVVSPAMALMACVAPFLLPALLGAQWTPAVPYFQVFCITNMLLPVHTTNLQSINAMGRSDLFLKLEIIKKMFGVCVLLYCAFILEDIWLLCCSYVLTGVVSAVINAWPNKTVLQYGFREQLRDLIPTAILTALASFIAMLVTLIGLPDIATVCLQCLAFIVVFIGLSVALHIEVFEYLCRTAKEMLGR